MRWIDLLTPVNTIDGFVEGALLVQSCNLVKEIKFREVNFEGSWYLCTYIVVRMLNNRMTKTVSWHTMTIFLRKKKRVDNSAKNQELSSWKPIISIFTYLQISFFFWENAIWHNCLSLGTRRSFSMHRYLHSIDVLWLIHSYFSGNWLDVEALATALALTGKASVVSCFCIIFIYSSELFPTVIRTVGMGCCAFWGRVGSLLAPQILLLVSIRNNFT